ncbi:hypothetical protein EVAR_68006_1 [Eumeta japonica]|uniref:Uncharacterized protein n=1 Tax=Eumeta variegata TaxID=151549 RepID=A0A4C1STP7_EUMVA|nr:hypothetical protein EVAR_68006_1 [Eumeta japonica]
MTALPVIRCLMVFPAFVKELVQQACHILPLSLIISDDLIISGSDSDTFKQKRFQRPKLRQREHCARGLPEWAPLEPQINITGLSDMIMQLGSDLHHREALDVISFPPSVAYFCLFLIPIETVGDVLVGPQQFHCPGSPL